MSQALSWLRGLASWMQYCANGANLATLYFAKPAEMCCGHAQSVASCSCSSTMAPMHNGEWHWTCYAILSADEISLICKTLTRLFNSTSLFLRVQHDHRFCYEHLYSGQHNLQQGLHLPRPASAKCCFKRSDQKRQDAEADLGGSALADCCA